jgi:hypothetical protein
MSMESYSPYYGFEAEYDPLDDDAELALIGLNAYLEAHNDPQIPFGITDMFEPINNMEIPPTMGTLKWCPVKQPDGTWDRGRDPDD